MKKAKNMKSLEDKDIFPPLRSDHQTVNLFRPERQHSGAVNPLTPGTFCKKCVFWTFW